jgi:hypothetical protein
VRTDLKRLAAAILSAFAILSTVVVGVYAAPERVPTGRAGRYKGIFRGFANGDCGSKALLTWDVTQHPGPPSIWATCGRLVKTLACVILLSGIDRPRHPLHRLPGSAWDGPGDRDGVEVLDRVAP